jgi:arylsulfatase A-like enzyme
MSQRGWDIPEGKPESLRASVTRREFLRGAAALASAAVLASCAPPAREGGTAAPGRVPGESPSVDQPRGDRPNFIFILVDDQRWDHLSCMDHPFLETPNMDRLAEEGVLFENAFVTTSLCSPSRASFLTGLYAHTHGVQNNLTPWDDGNVTFLEFLGSAGYRNGFIGKWHMPGKLPNLRGVDRFITFTVQGGQGRYFDCPLIIDGVETARPGTYITEDLTDLAIDFIREVQGEPFCLYLSHKAVHHQFLPPDDLDDLYAKADLSHLPEEYFSLQTLAAHNIYEGALGPLEAHYRNYNEALVAVDRELGRLLDELDALGLAENTVVVFTSDNGYSWGEHQINGKRLATEENMRIPFIVRYPGAIPNPGRRQTDMVLNVDLAPTLLDLAGVLVPEGMHGRSIKPLLMDRRVAWRESFLYEYFKDFPYNVPAHRAVRTDRHLYIEFEGRRAPELYDIVSDRRTLHDIIDDPEGQNVLPAMQALMREHTEGLSL